MYLEISKNIFRHTYVQYFYWAVLCLLIITKVYAYERPTHRNLSRASVLQSTISSVLPDLGLKSIDQKLMFVGDSGGRRIERIDTIINWIQYGADREDDLLTGDTLGRPKNHFFDPILGAPNNGGLITRSKLGITITGIPSLRWGLEDQIDYPKQFYSLREAKKYIYEALTASNKEDRESSFVKTFRTIGHVIHLVEDLAQPQHTRNDAHAGYGLGEESLYEKYTDKKQTVGMLDSLLQPGNYKSVRFTRADKYWKNNGKGLAEFSNNNFVSSGTNFTFLNGQTAPGSKYLLPQPSSPVTSDKPIEQLLAERGDTVPCGPEYVTASGCLEGSISFFQNIVYDKNTGDQELNERAASLSIFDADLQKYNKTFVCDYDEDDNPDCDADRLPTLNRFNFDAAHEFLIPRAVGYSAGLINYFFRARIKAKYLNEAPSGTQGMAAIEIINSGKVLLDGRFEIYYDRRVGASPEPVRTKLMEISRALSIAANSVNPDKITLEFTPPGTAAGNTGEYMVVFRGKAGEGQDAEEAVTGYKLVPGQIAFKGASRNRILNIVSATKPTVTISNYDGPFVGGTRIRPHPVERDLAIVYHHLEGKMGIVDYKNEKVINLPSGGYIGPNFYRQNLRYAANWYGSNKVVVAMFGTKWATNSYPWFIEAVVDYKIYQWDPDTHQVSLESQKTVNISYPNVHPYGGMERTWASWGTQLDNDLKHGVYMWSFDVGRDGVVVTSMEGISYDTSEVPTYADVPGCTIEVVTKFTRTRITIYKNYILRIYPDGTQDLGPPVTSASSNIILTTEYAEPVAPDSCGQGEWLQNTQQYNYSGTRLAHVDITPTGDLALSKENINSSGQLLVTPEIYSTISSSSTKWDANGHSLGTSSSENNYQRVMSGGVVVSEEGSYSVDGLELYDIQYDGDNMPWATIVTNQTRSPDRNSISNTTRFYFGNDTASKWLLFQANSPAEDPYTEFGPPAYPADVTTNPYGSGAVTAIHLFAHRGLTPDDPGRWWTPQPNSKYVVYGRSNAPKVDLYSINPAELEESVIFQFLP